MTDHEGNRMLTVLNKEMLHVRSSNYIDAQARP